MSDEPRMATSGDVVAKAEAVAHIVIQDTRRAIELEATLAAGNNAVHELTNTSWPGARCYNIIHDTLALSLASTLARLFDEGSSRGGKDAASIPLLISLLHREGCLAKLVERARGWVREMSTENEASAREALDSAIAALRTLRRDEARKAALATLTKFRNERLAHSLLEPAMDAIPSFKELSSLLETTMTIAGHLSMGVLGREWDAHEALRIVGDEAKVFWDKALAGVTRE